MFIHYDVSLEELENLLEPELELDVTPEQLGLPDKSEERGGSYERDANITFMNHILLTSAEHCFVELFKDMIAKGADLFTIDKVNNKNAVVLSARNAWKDPNNTILE